MLLSKTLKLTNYFWKKCRYARMMILKIRARFFIDIIIATNSFFANVGKLEMMNRNHNIALISGSFSNRKEQFLSPCMTQTTW